MVFVYAMISMFMTYSILYDGFNCVFQLLPEAITLKDVDDAKIEEKPFALVIAGRNTSGPEKGGNVELVNKHLVSKTDFSPHLRVLAKPH